MIFLMSPQGGEGGGGMMNIVLIVGMIFVFYFFMIRPQAKKAKEQKKFKEGIKNGDRVVTIGGIHGKVIESKENTVIIQVEGGGKLRVERSALSLEFSKGEETKSKPVEKLPQN